jgi:hypothetical protein
MNPVVAMPGTEDEALVTVRSRFVLSHVKFADPPNAPEELYWTLVFAPPGEPPPPPVMQTKLDPLNTDSHVLVFDQDRVPF